MPYSNSIGATPASLAAIADYLSNAGHAHHEDYELTPIQILGAKSVQEFLSRTKAAFYMNSRKGAGRPPQNAANWIIVRMPDESHLEPQEMAAYEKAASNAAGLGGPVVGIRNWHKNKYTGAADMNLLAAAFTSSGHLIRDRDSHNVKHLRWRMDQVTDALNVIRKSRGIPPIVTMVEIKKERAQQRGEADLVEVLAKMPMPPATTADLKPALLTLECEVTRFNPSRDTISVTMPRKKKAKRFRISKLLTDVADMVSHLRRNQGSGSQQGDGSHKGDGGQTLGTPKAPATKQKKPQEPEMAPP